MVNQPQSHSEVEAESVISAEGVACSWPVLWDKILELLRCHDLQLQDFPRTAKLTRLKLEGAARFVRMQLKMDR